MILFLLTKRHIHRSQVYLGVLKKNPLYDLPISISEMIEVDAVIITHLHIDYFDEEAKQQLPKNVPIYV